MHEVYTGSFEISNNGLVTPVSDEQVCPPARVCVDQAEFICAAGNGFARYQELVDLGVGMASCLPDCWPRASAVCRLAARYLEQQQALPAALAQPVYIRDNVADKPSAK